MDEDERGQPMEPTDQTGSTPELGLFDPDTVVVLVGPQDLVPEARAILQKWGPVSAGSPLGDFSVYHLEPGNGWVVGAYDPAILTFVSPAEVELREGLGPVPGDVGEGSIMEAAIGLVGRG